MNEKAIAVNKHCFAILDRAPATPDHVLIIPRRHVLALTDLSTEEYEGFQAILRELIERFITNGEYDSYNIGINQGTSAGQTVNHLHIHFFPRKAGDMDAPRGGVRLMFGPNTPYEHVDNSNN